MKRASVLTAVCLVLMATQAGIAVPYEVDSHTLHLYHFDGDTLDSVTINPIHLALDTGATVSDASFPGLGQALYTWEGTSRTGVNLPSALATPEKAVSNFVGPDGSFTFEAVVCPAVALGSIPNDMQIISGEHDSARGWQFRVDAAGNLAFLKLTGTIERFTAPVPRDGVHAFTPNKWFHAAVTYNGRADTDGNLKLYWTALDSGVSEPVLLGTFRLVASLDRSVAPFFVIGNEGRNNNGRTENWEGWIDEIRISDVARSPSEMVPQVMAGQATRPAPANGATDVSRDTVLSWEPGDSADKHDVYFGTSAGDVDAATATNPLGVLVSPGQVANTFDPGLLELDRTYYWRVDEVEAAPALTLHKGAVWSFTVEPRSYPSANVVATASSFNPGMGPENTVNGSGLNANDQHSVEATQMWLSGQAGPQPTWIQYEFDAVYKLDQVLVWNSNQLIESMLGFGAKGVTIEYSEDAVQWASLGEVELAQASGSATYTGSAVDLGGVAARFVKLRINSNWGGVVPQYGLAEVRFFQIPTRAREPQPADGATGVGVDALLTWRPGREAASHKVYFGASEQAVIDGTAAVKTTTDNQLYPGSYALGTTYYWKVTEVNETETPNAWEAAVWSFSTREYLVVDDMETYNDDDNRIYEAWVDGVTTGASGSTVGYLQAPFAEKAIVHGGKQSMPLAYDNADAPFFSEAERELAAAQNWTLNGADTLSLWVRGNPAAFAENGATITMSAGGHDIWDNADDFRYAFKTLTGDGSILVKVESLANTNNWAKAGVMIRQGLDADSKFVYFIQSFAQGVSMGWRPQVASTCSSVTQAGVAAPQWVKLTRKGDVFTAQYSANGMAWTDLKAADGTAASTTVAMTNPVYIGLCVTSHNTNATTTAVLSGAATAGNVTGGAWQVQAIGDDPQPANAPADLYVTVQDSAGKKATAVNPTAVTTAAWTQWQIPLSSLTGVNLKAVKKLIVGVDSRTRPTKGSGMIFVDDIGFGHPAQ